RAFFAVAVLVLHGAAWAGPRDFLIEHAGDGGSQAEAQPFLDKFMRWLEKACGWPVGSAQGAFFPEPKPAIQYIDEKKPAFGLLDPDMWLALRKKHDLQPIAQVEGKRQAAGNMAILVKNESPAKRLEDLKGKKLTSNHLQSPKYLSKV